MGFCHFKSDRIVGTTGSLKAVSENTNIHLKIIATYYFTLGWNKRYNNDLLQKVWCEGKYIL